MIDETTVLAQLQRYKKARQSLSVGVVEPIRDVASERDHSAKLTKLLSMGHARIISDRALRASGGDLGRAVLLIMRGFNTAEGLSGEVQAELDEWRKVHAQSTRIGQLRGWELDDSKEARAIRSLVDMGFPRNACDMALKRCDGDLGRATMELTRERRSQAGGIEGQMAEIQALHAELHTAGKEGARGGPVQHSVNASTERLRAMGFEEHLCQVRAGGLGEPEGGCVGAVVVYYAEGSPCHVLCSGAVLCRRRYRPQRGTSDRR